MTRHVFLWYGSYMVEDGSIRTWALLAQVSGKGPGSNPPKGKQLWHEQVISESPIALDDPSHPYHKARSWARDNGCHVVRMRESGIG